MSRRAPRAKPDREPASPAPAERPRNGSSRVATIAAQAALLLAVFAAGTGLALLAGAANTGTAMGIGQIAFVIVLLFLLLRR
jgi:hypothetical protein